MHVLHLYTRQIVGLTASVGVGRGASVMGAVKHIQELCAKLDCTLHTVQREKEALNRYLKDHKKRTHYINFYSLDFRTFA